MKGCYWVGALLAATLLAATAWVQGAVVVSVTEHGAKGDGKTLDRTALNRAVEACAGAGSGQVRVPPGRYLTGTVRLRSGITLMLDAGAVLVGTPDLEQYESYAPPESRPGDRNHWHSAAQGPQPNLTSRIATVRGCSQSRCHASAPRRSRL